MKVLLLDVNDELFKSCFGKDDDWPCQLESLGNKPSKDAIEAKLSEPGLGCVIVQGLDYADVVLPYYQKGGFVVYFGIYGEFDAPRRLSQVFGLDWSFSGYTKYDYQVTEAGQAVFGNEVMDQQYTKSNLLRVPADERLLAPKVEPTLEEYMKAEMGEGPFDEEDMEEGRRGYEYTKQCSLTQVPLAMHTNANGGRIAYLGFVNGDGNVPLFVRALCTSTKVTQEQVKKAPPKVSVRGIVFG